MFVPRFAKRHYVKSDIWEMDREHTDLRVENIVVGGLLLGLPEDDRKQEQSKHSKFPHRLHFGFEFNGYSCKVFLYSGGIVNCVGIKAYEDIAPCVLKAYEHICLRYPSYDISILTLSIHNIVASGHTDCHIKLALLEKVHRYKVTYQPSKFPGAYLCEGDKKLGELVTVGKIFGPGAYYTVGARTHENIVVNGIRLPRYIAPVIYNHVCTRQLGPIAPLEELVGLVNRSCLRDLCGQFEYMPNKGKPQPFLRSAEFHYPGAWDTARQGPRFLFTAYIPADGTVYETATRPLKKFTLRQRMNMAQNTADTVAPVNAITAYGEPTPEDELYTEIPMRPSTLIPRTAVKLLSWAEQLNKSSVRDFIGKANLIVAGTHFYVQTAREVLLHGDGDLCIPPGLGLTKEREKLLANAIWDACGFENYKVYTKQQVTLDGECVQQHVSLNLKKVAADINREGVKCKYEPLATVIRLEMGAIITADGKVCKAPSCPLVPGFIWRIAKMNKVGKRGQQKTLEQPPRKVKKSTDAEEEHPSRKARKGATDVEEEQPQRKARKVAADVEEDEK